MKVPCCSVCQTRYNEEERVPLLLQCGHGFCKECLSRMFSAALDASLPCPRCRHVSLVGNSVLALKNYGILALLNSNPNSAGPNSRNDFDFDYTDDEGDGDNEERDEDDDNGDIFHDIVGGRINRGSNASSSGATAAAGCGPVIELTAHPEVKLVRKIEGKGEGKGGRAGVETWAAVISGVPVYGGGGGGGAGRRCKHKVAVKKVGAMEGMFVGMWCKLESLRRASMWCRNVCTFHGVIKLDENSLDIVMDRCHGSIQSAMFNNEGRLTLEQVPRSCYWLELTLMLWMMEVNLCFIELWPRNIQTVPLSYWKMEAVLQWLS